MKNYLNERNKVINCYKENFLDVLTDEDTIKLNQLTQGAGAITEVFNERFIDIDEMEENEIVYNIAFLLRAICSIKDSNSVVENWLKDGNELQQFIAVSAVPFVSYSSNFVPLLLNVIDNGNEDCRSRAISSLSLIESGESGIFERLENCYVDKEEDVRRLAIRSSSSFSFGPEKLAPYVLRAYLYDTDLVKEAAIRVIKTDFGLAKASIIYLIEALKCKHKLKKVSDLLIAIGINHESEPVPYLNHLIQNAEYEVAFVANEIREEIAKHMVEQMTYH